MRTIALMNQKGGVGKTTTTANLGAALAELGKRICLIDLDPQAHLTINYGVEPSGDHASLYDVLVDECSFLEAIHKIDQRIALMPSSIDLAAAEVELVSVAGRESLLKKKMESAQHDFDFVLLDCPPSLGLLTLNALSVATEVLIPMQPHFLALQGVAKLLETVHLVSRRINPALKVTGVILTMFDSQTKLSGEVVSELNNFIAQAAGKNLPWSGAKVFRQKIRRNIKLAECPSFGQTILKYDSSSNGAADYRNLARELLDMPPIAVTKVTVTPARGTRPASGLAVPAAKLAAATMARKTSNANQPRGANQSAKTHPPAAAPNKSAMPPDTCAAPQPVAAVRPPAAAAAPASPPAHVEVTISPSIPPARIPPQLEEPELATADTGDVTDL